jgi:hypothetical protein
MMQDAQNTLFINSYDVRNPVIYDGAWLPTAARRAGLTICRAVAPDVRGLHWHVYMTPTRPSVAEVEIPADSVEVGRRPPLDMPPGASEIGRQS